MIEVCANGLARLKAERPQAPSLEDFPVAEVPAERHPPIPEALANVGVLGSVDAGFHAIGGA